MRHLVMIGAALVALGCGSPEETCLAAAYDLHVWACETCGGTSLCPSGDPGTLDSFRESIRARSCQGVTDDAQALVYECSLQCNMELVDDGILPCPPAPNPPTWQLEQADCINACLGE